MNSSYDGYVYAIAILLPISAGMLISQTNPYNALVIRGILGALSALVYTILGAGDVALTEALVGAFLATMLYAVAVRSSLVLRLGVVESVAIAHNLEEEELNKLNLPFEQLNQQLNQLNQQMEQQLEQPKQNRDPVPSSDSSSDLKKLIDVLKSTFSKHYMRVELVPYSNEAELEQALTDKTVHATLHNSEHQDAAEYQEGAKSSFYQIKIRLHRLYEIMLTNPVLANVQLVYTNAANSVAISYTSIAK
jgi:putative multicomponent Na+:H+ antiporter subunit B